MKIQRPLIDMEVHGYAIVGSDFDAPAVVGHLDILQFHRNIQSVRFLEEALPDLIGRLMIDYGKSRRRLHGVLKLVIGEIVRHDPNAHIYEGDQDTQPEQGLNIA